jgi:hypothetical protein
MKGRANMTSMAGVNIIMTTETKQRKRQIMIGGISGASFCLVLAALHLARYASLMKWQGIQEDLSEERRLQFGGFGAIGDFASGVGDAFSGGNPTMPLRCEDPENTICYDVGCNTSGITDFGDLVDAGIYLSAQASFCLGDEDCLNKGSKWSHIFLMNGLILICITLNYICIAVGAHKPLMRLIAAWVAPFLCCAHIGIIIATAVYRFSDAGKICALSE